MKKGWIATWFGVLSLVLVPGLAFGNGFAINEQDAKAVAMGGAFVAQADDPSAVYYNPAGILQLDGTQVSAGMSVIKPHASFKTDGNRATPLLGPYAGPSAGATTSIKDVTFWIPNAYMTQKMNDRWGFGFGAFANFGLSTEWPEDWEGRFIVGGVKAEINTLSVNPVVAFKPIEKLTLSAGPVLQYLDIALKYRMPVAAGIGAPEAGVKLTGDDWDWGWNAGLLYSITDTLKFGASYRSQIKHKIERGDIKFSPEGANGFSNTKGDAPITLPAIAYLGLAWSPKPLTLEFDLQWTQWSTFDKLEVNFDQPLAGVVSGLEREKNWKNVWAYRFGAQYTLNEYLDLRAGVIYDKSPIPDSTLDPLIPSGDRWLYCLGFGTHYQSFTFDFAYNYLQDESRKFNNAVGDAPTNPVTGVPLFPPGTRMTGKFKDGDAHIFAINLSYKF
jgi:long-chain fatty acid transport protein